MQNKVFQDVWNEKFPWVKLVVDAHGKAYQIKCNMYTKLEGKEKFLALKLSNHWKHDGKEGFNCSHRNL